MKNIEIQEFRMNNIATEQPKSPAGNLKNTQTSQEVPFECNIKDKQSWYRGTPEALKAATDFMSEKWGIEPLFALRNIERVDEVVASTRINRAAPSGGWWFEGCNGQGQLRPDNPWKNGKHKDGTDKFAKYVSPSVETPYDAILVNYGFIPTLKFIKDNCIWIDGKPWIVITEGVKKAIHGCQKGVFTTALLGIRMGLEPQKRNNGKKILVRTLKWLAETGLFGFIIAFDADCKTNPDIKDAERDLAKALSSYGCPVRSVTGMWEPEQGKGMDDFIMQNGFDAFEELLNNAKAIEGLEKQFKKKNKSENEPTKYTIFANELAEEFRDKLLYNNENGRWMYYSRTRKGIWEPITKEEVCSIIKKNVDARGLTEYAGKSYIDGAEYLLRHTLFESEWKEASPFEYMPFENKVLSLKDGKTFNHSPGFKFTWCLPRKYDETDADWSLIDNWLNEVTGGDDGLKQVLLCYANAVLKGRSELQRVLVTVGQGGTGKTLFQSLIIALVGEENVHTTTLSQLNGSQFEAASCHNKRLVVFPDEDKYSGGLSVFKSLSGRGEIHYERKGKDAGRSFKYDGMIMIASNHSVFRSESSSAISRRLITVPFTCSPSKINPHLFQELASQLNAFTNYLLTIPDEYVAKILLAKSSSPREELATHQHLEAKDSVYWFLNNYLIREPSACIQIGNDKNEGKGNGLGNIPTLYAAYHQRCEAEGKSAKSSIEFSNHLIDLCNNILGWGDIKRVTKNGGRRHISGLRLRVVGADDAIPTLEEEIIKKVEQPLTNPHYPHCSLPDRDSDSHHYSHSTLTTTLTASNLADEAVSQETENTGSETPSETKSESSGEDSNCCSTSVSEGSEGIEPISIEHKATEDNCDADIVINDADITKPDADITQTKIEQPTNQAHVDLILSSLHEMPEIEPPFKKGDIVRLKNQPKAKDLIVTTIYNGKVWATVLNKANGRPMDGMPSNELEPSQIEKVATSNK